MNWASVVKSTAKEPKPVKASTQDDAKVAVVDTNALIRGFQLERIASRAVTVKEVLAEVRDKKSREWLDRLPFGIDVEEPDEDCLKAVVRFARATGDLSFLSEVDVRVIALTRSLEKSAHGLENIKGLPEQVKVKSEHVSKGASMPGWGDVPNPEDWVAVDELNEREAQGLVEGATTSGQSKILSTLGALSLIDATNTEGQDLTDGEGGEERENGSSNHEPITPEGRDLAGCEFRGGEQVEGNLDDGVGVVDANGQGVEGGDDKWQVAKSSKKKKAVVEKSVEGAGEQQSDEEAGAEEDSEEASKSSVGCITSDFSMQNVLIQMGLRVVTPDGRRIREVKRWAMRCSACFFVTKEVGRIFCAKCGKASVERVELRTDADGSEVFGVRTKHRTRGTKYSIPMPKGGKRNKDPILSEDVMNQRLKTFTAPRKEKKMMDAFAPEYGTDTWHKMTVAKQGIKDLLPNRKNPNERKHGKRRK
ncbi:hypothetical protein BSKO_12998 [Bryopsis sp. KO-2023]|nr:hypothetical protein BSKO_12998 [Bryopsis sp. KO-2023]